MAYVGVDLAMVDDLVAALLAVRSRTDELEFDLRRATALSEIDPGVTAAAADLGDRCHRFGHEVRVRTTRLQNFRPMFGHFGYGPARLRPPNRPRRPLSSSQRQRLQAMPKSSRSLYRRLLGDGYAERDAFNTLLGLDYARSIIGDPSPFYGTQTMDLDDVERASLAHLIRDFDALLAASDQMAGGPPRVGGAWGDLRTPEQKLGGELTRSIPIEHLVAIAADPDAWGDLARSALIILGAPTMLQKLDGAAERKGDMLGDVELSGDGRYSLADVAALTLQVQIAQALRARADDIDVAHEGGTAEDRDGFNSEDDYEAFFEDIVGVDPLQTAYVQAAIDAGYFDDEFGADEIGELAEHIGTVLAVVALLAATAGVGAAAAGFITGAALGAGAVQTGAGIGARDFEMGLGGALNVLGAIPRPAVLKAMSHLNLSDEAIRSVDDLSSFRRLLDGVEGVPIDVADDGSTLLTRLVAPGDQGQLDEIIDIVDDVAYLKVDASPGVVHEVAVRAVKDASTDFGAIATMTVAEIDAALWGPEVADAAIGVGLSISAAHAAKATTRGLSTRYGRAPTSADKEADGSDSLNDSSVNETVVRSGRDPRTRSSFAGSAG